MNPRPTLPLLFVALAALPARAQQQEPEKAPTPETRLQAEQVQGAEDVALTLDRLDRLAVIEKQGTLAPLALGELRNSILASGRSVVVTGVLDDVPLPRALDAVLAAAGAKGGRVSVVLSRADREIMSTLRVSATFHGARDVDAVRALLRLHESAHHDDKAYLEWSEDAGVFVVRATQLDAQPDLIMGQPLQLDPFRVEPGLPPQPSGPRAWLGVSWVDQNPRGPGAGGVLVTQVLPGSPAVTAGLQAGDLITGFGEDGDEDEDDTVMNGDDLRAKIAGHAPGDVVIVVFVREGAVRRVSLVLGTTPGR